jgi:2-iminobutanoate/2-iminopropanoate deaminase
MMTFLANKCGLTSRQHRAKLTVLTLLISGVTSSSSAAEIVRHASSPSAIILSSVRLPPGAEIVMVSGQLASPIDPARTDDIDAYGDTKTQTISVFNKIEIMLARQGYAMSDIVKLTVFVAGDPKLGGTMDFAGFNEGYKQFFGTPENPNLVVRSTVQVAALAGPGFLVEIEAIAAKPPTAPAQ